MASDSGTAKLHGSTATAIEKSKLVVGKFYRPKVYMPNLEGEERRGGGGSIFRRFSVRCKR